MGMLLGELDYPDPMPYFCGCCASLGALFLVVLAVTLMVHLIRRDRPPHDA